MNNRLGGDYKGDTETPEGFIPSKGYEGRDWETCMTMNDSWGFKRDDNNWKSTATLLRNLCDIASKGGNYLLNVGPDSDGLIPGPSIVCLSEIGKWMGKNSEAIYGCGPTPFGDEAGKFSNTEKDEKGNPKFISSWDWRCTTKPGKIFLLIFHWPADHKFKLSGLQSKVTKAYLLADGKILEAKQNTTGVIISLPEEMPDNIASVVCLEIGEQFARIARQK